MRIARIIPKTYAEGPGCRFSIWVQGCANACPGCFARDLWPYDGGTERSVEEIITQLDNVASEISGITLLGGEPFDKAAELSLIASHAKKRGKNVICFTGYDFENLTGRDAQNLLRSVDILIDGRFEIEKLDFSRPLVGSSNQKIRFLTDRITPDEFYAYKNRFEVRTDAHGKILINGMGDTEKLMIYMKGLV